MESKVTEIARLSIPLLAVVGSVILGYVNPNLYGAASIGVLSGAVSGFYGSSLPSPAKTFEKLAEKEEEKP